jgi:hypothetical protein
MAFEFFSPANRPKRALGAERRATARGRVLFRGKIIHGPGLTADCSIRNLSAGGAGLKFPESMAAPRDFHLIVVRNGVAHRARRAWTRYPMVGVKFEASDDLTQPPIPLRLQGLRNLWAALVA